MIALISGGGRMMPMAFVCVASFLMASSSSAGGKCVRASPTAIIAVEVASCTSPAATKAPAAGLGSAAILLSARGVAWSERSFRTVL